MYIQYHWMPYHRKGYSVLTIKDLSITRGQGEQSFTVSLPHLSLAEGEVVFTLWFERLWKKHAIGNDGANFKTG